jgi:PHD/YefM family antitoxin component YafN of YafNO toxin-antitoxin module
MYKIISVTDLVRNASSIARDVASEGTVYRITRGGRGSMVLLDEEYFNGWMAALDEMRRPDWREVHDRTTRDIAAGRGRDLDVVARELKLEGRSHTSRGEPARRAPRTRRKKSR